MFCAALLVEFLGIIALEPLNCSMKVEWSGLFVELLTTFKSDGSLDLVAYQLQIETMIQAGADGLIIAGDWGEGDALTQSEKYHLLVAATEQSHLRVPVIMAIMEANFPGGVHFAKEADTAGADGFLLYPPTGRQLTEDDFLKFYMAVTTATQVPVMLIETEERQLKHRFLASIAGIPQIKAVAEQSRTISSLDGRFKVFAGTSTAPAARIGAGAAGWLAGGTTIFPQVARALYEFAKNQDSTAEILENWYNLLLAQTAYPAGVQIAKCIQAEAGKSSETVRPPRSRLSNEERATIIAIAKEMVATLPIYT
ncbi:MAG TPA: dihydrodipicolinate synthase family protein [Bacteroidetes bacterium]|nr:dihydrodipicolinate synthase family protein [Bacteroidota bacterium]